LKPIKAKELIVSTALELNIPVSVVEDVVTSYWKDVRSSLSELKAPIINVYAFGNFTIKHWLLEKEKERLIKSRDRILQRNSKRSVIILEELNTKISLIEQIEEMYYSEKQRKDFIKTHKKRHVKTNI
jgi:hypothetical protein